MFGVKHNECVGFESRWKVTKVSAESSSQTTEFSTSDKQCDTTQKSSIETQTDTSENTKKQENEVEMEKLAQWLGKIYPQVHKELDKSAKSRVFRGYRLHDDEDVEFKLLQTINVATFDAGDDSCKISLLSWSNTGMTLAVATNYSHTNWCHHSGEIFIYFLSSDGKIPNVPKTKLHTKTCVTSLHFHPIYSGVLAASTFSGHILIWNVQSDEEDSLILDVIAHNEFITQILWINDIDNSKNALLATSSVDGILKTWNFDYSNRSLSIKASYKIKPPILGSSHKSEEKTSGKSNRAVTCFDFSKHIPEMFMVGLEGGLLVQCSLLGASKLKGSTDEEPLLDPVFKYYEPHESELVSVKFSPNRKDMFLSLGTDTEVRIYLIGQEEPAQVIFLKNPLTDISWVPHEEKLLAGCGQFGTIEIFSAPTGKAIDNAAKEAVQKCARTCLSINSKRPNMIVVADVKGQLQNWSIPWHSIASKC